MLTKEKVKTVLLPFTAGFIAAAGFMIGAGALSAAFETVHIFGVAVVATFAAIAGTTLHVFNKEVAHVRSGKAIKGNDGKEYLTYDAKKPAVSDKFMNAFKGAAIGGLLGFCIGDRLADLETKEQKIFNREMRKVDAVCETMPCTKSPDGKSVTITLPSAPKTK